ncbi:hypothetical protein GIB67_030588, partial [Kingdonia uniflora]
GICDDMSLNFYLVVYDDIRGIACRRVGDASEPFSRYSPVFWTSNTTFIDSLFSLEEERLYESHIHLQPPVAENHSYGHSPLIEDEAILRILNINSCYDLVIPDLIGSSINTRHVEGRIWHYANGTFGFGFLRNNFIVDLKHIVVNKISSRQAMEAVSEPKIDPEKSCCAKLREKYAKLENGRNALRKAVNLLQKEYDEEIKKKETESAVRVSLENEILNLKSEISSLQKRLGSQDQNEDGERICLRTCVAEWEAEITRFRNCVAGGEAEVVRLKDILEKEKNKGVLERKKAEAEKKKATEEKTKQSSSRVSLENEISRLKSELALLQARKSTKDQDQVPLLQTRISKGDAEIRQLKDLLEKEKKRGDLEKKKVETEKKRAAETHNLVVCEKNKAEEANRLANIERKKAEECRLCLERLKAEINYLNRKLVSKRFKTEQKANKEKKHADSKMAKAEDQRKCIEQERKKTMDEKNRSNQLFKQLEEERQRNEALEKAIEDLTSARKMGLSHPISSFYTLSTETTNMMLLKEQRKLDKMHAKHSKSVAEFERMRSDSLQQEVHRLNHAFIQLTRRLNILESSTYHSIEGIDPQIKFNDSLKLQRSSMRSIHSGNEPHELYGQSKNELLKACYTTVDGFDGLRSTPVPGINTEVDSLFGGSVRDKVQNSALYSTITSSSDRTPLGSQGRGAFSVTGSPRIPGEMAVNCFNENHNLVVSENIVKCQIPGNLEDPCLKSTRDCVNDIGGEKRHTGKRKRVEDVMGAIEFLLSEDKKLRCRIEEQLSDLNNTLILKGNDQISEKKRKSTDQQTTILQQFGKANECEQSKNLVNEVGREPNIFDSAFESITNGDYMKLLELDTPSEEIYRRAMARPLSPTLPVIEMPNLKAGCSGKQIEEVFCRELTNEKDNFVTSCSFDVINIEIESNDMKYPHNLDRSVSHQAITTQSIFQKNNEDDSHIAKDSGKPCIHMFSEPSRATEVLTAMHIEKENLVASCGVSDDTVKIATKELKNSCIFGGSLQYQLSAESIFEDNNDDSSQIATDSGPFIDQFSGHSRAMKVLKGMPNCDREGAGALCTSIGGLTQERSTGFCVVYSNCKDRRSISRIISAKETCISQKEMSVQSTIFALSLKQDLMPQEKACVLFSLLLHNYSAVSSKSCLCLDSFSTHMKTVMSDEETRCKLIALCQLDTLLNLIEDFLVKGKVLVYYDISGDTHVSHNSARTMLLIEEGRTLFVSSEIATFDQLVGGSVIMASACVAFDYVASLCEASCNLLRSHQYDSSLTLTILHVFASLCGNQYLLKGNYDMIMSVVKSMVTFLERGNESTLYPRCAHCPFSEDSISLHEVMSLLLKWLESYAVQGFKDMVELVACSNNRTPLLSTSFVNETSHQVIEILSLVELVASYLKWDWIFHEIVAKLLKMVELCVSEKVSASIIILLGQLGR